MPDTIPEFEANLAGAMTETEKMTVLAALVRELRTADDPLVLASRLSLIEDLPGVLAQHAQARQDMEEILALSRLHSDRLLESRCLYVIGRSHFLRNEYPEAIENIHAAFPAQEALQDWEGLGASFNSLGIIQDSLSDYEQALEWYARSLEARERAGDQEGIGGSLNNIGTVYVGMENYSQALSFHQRSLDQARRIGSLRLEVDVLCNLGADYTGLGRYAEALEVSRRVVALGEPLKAWAQVAVAFSNMDQVYAKTQQHIEALKHCAQALEVVRSTQNLEVAAEILCSMGKTLTVLGALSEARTHLAEAAALAQTAGARKVAFQAFEGLSEVCKRQGDYAAALGHYEMFRRLEKEVFTEEADKRAKSLVIQMDVEHHRREAETLAEINTALQESNARLEDANGQLEDANGRLEALATTDPLTGLPNHRSLVAALDAQLAGVRRSGRPCALLFLDIDHFKSFNDTYGHPVGDAVLVEFAACVRACLREEDTLGRWGGEEFLILLPSTDAEEALRIGERVRAEVAAHPLSVGAGLGMTCSIGAAACPPQEAIRGVLVEAADQALYAAKRLGRNQVRGAGDPAILTLSGPLAPDEAAHFHHSRQGTAGRPLPSRLAS